MSSPPILVFGVLLDRGLTVRGLARKPDSLAAQRLKALGVEVVKGDARSAAAPR